MIIVVNPYYQRTYVQRGRPAHPKSLPPKDLRRFPLANTMPKATEPQTIFLFSRNTYRNENGTLARRQG